MFIKKVTEQKGIVSFVGTLPGEVLQKAATLHTNKITVSLEVTPCRMLDKYQHFRRIRFLQ